MYKTYFDPEFFDELESLKEDEPQKYNVVITKCKEIANSLEWSSDHYKNLEYPLNKYKRVHLFKNHFVLVFRVNKWDKSVLFVAFDHHDKIYKNKRLITHQ